MRKLLTAAAMAVSASSAFSAPVTSPTDFTPTAPVVDFEAFVLGTASPITVGPMTVAAPGYIVRAQNFTQYPGIFEGQYFGQASSSTVTITFDVAVRAVGFGLFDPNFPATQLQAFDAAGDLLETVFPPTGPIGGGFSTFTGVVRNIAEIRSVVVTPQSGDLIAIDTISWATSIEPIPVPPAAALLLGGVGVLAGFRRRRSS
ncbi:MAG: VPLPA-CTERM sorting domain-containing protein [Paracoccaceae bacterium]|jgi:hypothetical protein|nr:VPLPA-CTERM sorting domain-containing protein [Paracoccaceae bacterium]